MLKPVGGGSGIWAATVQAGRGREGESLQDVNGGAKVTVGRKHRKDYGLLAGAAALVTVPSPIGAAIASAHKAGVARTSLARQMTPASVHSRLIAGVSPLAPPTLTAADTFVNQGQPAELSPSDVWTWTCDLDLSVPGVM